MAGGTNQGSGGPTHFAGTFTMPSSFYVTLGADGLMHMQFYETFVDDFPDQPDGFWQSGTLTFTVTHVPEPGTWGLMALGLAGVVRLRAGRG